VLLQGGSYYDNFVNLFNTIASKFGAVSSAAISAAKSAAISAASSAASTVSSAAKSAASAASSAATVAITTVSTLQEYVSGGLLYAQDIALKVEDFKNNIASLYSAFTDNIKENKALMTLLAVMTRDFFLINIESDVKKRAGLILDNQKRMLVLKCIAQASWAATM